MLPPPSRIGIARPGQMRYCKVTLAISLLNETTPTYLISALISTFVSSDESQERKQQLLTVGSPYLPKLDFNVGCGGCDDE